MYYSTWLFQLHNTDTPFVWIQLELHVHQSLQPATFIRIFFISQWLPELILY